MIGVFDSGYGGLTVFRAIRDALPQYDYLYLGDNARAPYGNRSFESIHEYTWQCVQWMFAQGCPLVILACNTASAKALRSIQQGDMPGRHDSERVLGVIRPTAEVIGDYSNTGHVGILGTTGTVQSESYLLEIRKFYPEVSVYQQACPLWVPLVEAGEHEGEGADYIVEKNLSQLLQQSPDIDTVLLACTHYPLLSPKILTYLPEGIRLISQGSIVAESLKSYLERHPEMAQRLPQNGQIRFFTTDSDKDFNQKATMFFGEDVHSEQIHL
jgi:glutamate racemase